MTYTIDWQLLLVLAIVVAAVAHLGRRAWQLLTARGQPSCGGCGTCPTGESTGDGFVSIKSLGPKQQSGTGC